jgi:glyoxylase-like metal-dependent hydrolase (beta-lactamase superfamily II)
MLLQHFFTPKIAHSSYLLAGSETCAIIDPRRDVQVYIEAARAQGVRITHILETHLHADFVSGHLELAERTGAAIYAPASAQCLFEHVPLAEGDIIQIEHLRLDVIETPGHTPEHVSYLVTDTTRSQEPVGVFCGDTLFVGDVGRPDLFPGRAQELAEALFHSLHAKLLRLPDFVEVYPAHGAGSLCGRSMGAKWTSTIGYERRANAALSIADRDAFIASLTTDMPPAPDHFARCSEINRQGPPLVDQLPGMALLAPSAFQERLARGQTLALDLRGYDAFCAQHIADSWHIGFPGNLPTFAGWVLPPEADILLVADNVAQAEEARVWLRRVGLDRTVGYLDGGPSAWAAEGLPTARVRLISVHELHERVTGDEHLTLVDVRAPAEFAERHIQGAINIPGPELRTRHAELDPGQPIYLVCSTGNRSGMAASILQQNGFEQVYNVAGGMTGYSAAGYSQRCSVCVNPHGPKTLVFYDPTLLSAHSS